MATTSPECHCFYATGPSRSSPPDSHGVQYSDLSIAPQVDGVLMNRLAGADRRRSTDSQAAGSNNSSTESAQKQDPDDDQVNGPEAQGFHVTAGIPSRDHAM